MSDNRWRRIEAIFHEAAELPPEARCSFLDEACVGDESLRREVESLLSNDAGSGDTLAAAVAQAAEGAARTQDLIGKRIGPYEVTGRIGEGGMGVVYRARDTQLDRTVAIKVLPPDWTADTARKRRFLQEAKAISALNHPNIVTIHTIVQDGAAECIVMEYVAGRTLSEAIAKKGLPLKEALPIAIGIADAMVAAHAAGIVHRDLKPSNIMVTESGHVKVLDFGLAKLVGSGETPATPNQSIAGQVIGTAAYMSPEQGQGLKVDARSDIFSFGCVLYEMLTGRRAFHGDSAISTLMAILHNEPEPVQKWNRTLPTRLTHIVTRALEKDRGLRFQTAADLLADLRRLQHQVDAGQVLQRKRSWIWALVAVVLALGALGIVNEFRTPRAAPADAQSGLRLSTGDHASATQEANEYFERAVLFLLSSSDLLAARKMLEKALTLDPKFSAARALYGFCHWRLINWGYSNDTAWLYKAEEELRLALKEDPRVQAHGPLAAVYFTQGRKELALSEIDQALKVRPDDKYALHWLAHYHRFHGNYQGAIDLWRKIGEHEPMFWPSRMNIGDTLRMMGDIQGAAREFEKILEQSPGNVFAQHYLAMSQLTDGEPKAARRTLERVRMEDRQRFLIRMPWALLLALEGARDQAIKEMDEELLKWAATDILMPLNVAEFYSILGETTKALDWLERCVRSGDERAEWYRNDPLLAGIRGQHRFHQLLGIVEHRRQQRGTK